MYAELLADFSGVLTDVSEVALPTNRSVDFSDEFEKHNSAKLLTDLSGVLAGVSALPINRSIDFDVLTNVSEFY